ncbi:hypothetical protein V2L60_14815, partial [Staphylococcus gallinarum]
MAVDLLPRLYALCGEAQRVCASLAVDAALGQPASTDDGIAARLAHETAREHVLRIWLDWPRQLGTSGSDNVRTVLPGSRALTD